MAEDGLEVTWTTAWPVTGASYWITLADRRQLYVSFLDLSLAELTGSDPSSCNFE